MSTNEMNNDVVIKEVTINAPAAKVWQAITDKRKMKQWYFDIADFEPEVGFEFTFIGKNKEGQDYVHLCRITEVIPGKKLQHTWAYEGFEGMSYVTWELTEEGDITRLKLTHTGLSTFPPTPMFASNNFNTGWTQLVQKSIKEFVENN